MVVAGIQGVDPCGKVEAITLENLLLAGGLIHEVGKRELSNGLEVRVGRNPIPEYVKGGQEDVLALTQVCLGSVEAGQEVVSPRCCGGRGRDVED